MHFLEPPGIGKSHLTKQLVENESFRYTVRELGYELTRQIPAVPGTSAPPGTPRGICPQVLPLPQGAAGGMQRTPIG